MSLRTILTWPDDRLCTVCTPVGAITPDVLSLAEDMLETMYAAPGRGLAAPQVGVTTRMFVMDPTWKEGARSPMVCINPAIVSMGDEVAEGSEGCLSIPGVSTLVTRPTSVGMTWMDLDGVQHTQTLTGFAALCAQHELDHLDGILTLDRIDADQRKAVLAAYEAA